MTLTPEQIQRKQELTQKLHNQVLNPIEAGELRDILEVEKKDATSLGDVAKAIGLILLIGVVVAYLSEK